MKLKIFQIALLFVIIGLGYWLWEIVQTPVRFNKDKEIRAEAVIQNLKDIRTVQQVYRALNDSFLPNFDTLIWFMREGQIPVVNIIFDPSDTTLTKTINDTLGFVRVSDSLFGSRKNFKINDIRYIPFSEGEEFEMSSGRIDRSGLKVPVFMAIATKEQYLKGLDRNLTKNPNVKDLIVGSITEPTTDGNWE